MYSMWTIVNSKYCIASLKVAETVDLKRSHHKIKSFVIMDGDDDNQTYCADHFTI